MHKWINFGQLHPNFSRKVKKKIEKKPFWRKFTIKNVNAQRNILKNDGKGKLKTLIS